MGPREETISVGGIGVHAWVGGHGEPLLRLHGAGDNRGWARWLEVQESRMDHATTMRSIELMGAKVIPAMAAL